MKELNQNTLREALHRLPEYEAPAGIWDHLEAVLEADAALTDAARQMGQYAPPALVWENITAQLPVARPVTRRMPMWSRYAAAAALVGILFGAWWLLNTAGQTSGQIVVTQETMDAQIAATVREREDEAFNWVETLCASRAPICEQPDFKNLKSELDELTAAKQRLHAALGQYGDDPTLANQLVQIEITRTQLLQEMMQMI